MPLVKIEMRKGKSTEYKKALFDGVHQALVDAFKIPDHDRMQRLYELDQNDFELSSDDEWFAQFDFTQRPNMMLLEKAHVGHLPVWCEGNVYLNGAQPCKKEVNALCIENTDQEIKVELKEKEGRHILETHLYEYIKTFKNRMIDTDILGKAFEPEALFENPDGTPIRFDTDYFGHKREENVIPGPFARAADIIDLDA